MHPPNSNPSGRGRPAPRNPHLCSWQPPFDRRRYRPRVCRSGCGPLPRPARSTPRTSRPLGDLDRRINNGWHAAGVTPTIALVGSGEYLDACRPVDEYLLALLDIGERLPRVACLPTAAAKDGERVWRGWQDRGVAHFARLGAEAIAVDVIDRDTADDDAMVRDIAGADLVYLSGGKPALLYQLLEGSAAWAAILGVLDRGGVLAGCSAGAMVQGSHIAGLRGGAGSQGFGLL